MEDPRPAAHAPVARHMAGAPGLGLRHGKALAALLVVAAALASACAFLTMPINAALVCLWAIIGLAAFAW